MHPTIFKDSPTSLQGFACRLRMQQDHESRVPWLGLTNICACARSRSHTYVYQLLSTSRLFFVRDPETPNDVFVRES